MGVNRITGETSVNIGGKDYPIVYDWDALAKLDEAFPSGMDLTNTSVLAEVVAIGVAELSADDVLEASPPLMPTIQAVTRAHNLAYYGSVETPEVDDHPPKARKAGLRMRLRRLFGLESSQSNSGD